MRKSALAATLVAAWVFAAGSAHAQSPTPARHPVRPNQFFDGRVNDRPLESVIVLRCASAARTGHPVAGQHVSVHQQFPPSIDRGLGFTGAGSTIAATLRVLSPTAAAAAPIPLAVFSVYDQPVAIPTTLSLPCGGAGAVVFEPVQGGDPARSYTTRVAFRTITPTDG